MKKDLEIKAKKLRIKGYSVKELHQILGVSKSTVSGWIQGVKLSEKAQMRLRKNYTNGQLASQKTIKEKTHQKNIIADNFAREILSKMNYTTADLALLCSMIYFCEGNKSLKSLVTFTNSDPDLITTFIFLFRNSFKLDESKFRVLMHLHKYHNEKYKKEGYQGCIKIYYGDVSIARKLRSIAKMFMERYK